MVGPTLPPTREDRVSDDPNKHYFEIAGLRFHSNPDLQDFSKDNGLATKTISLIIKSFRSFTFPCLITKRRF